ncbi:receptor-like protein kinase ANXUR1 isoform X1 [Primulina eburnea]|uniref:receptor-like protein kinase ANXUR1 isoform X1 n=1 Tax=Primulina eburnea TaxID=1245227 RepID=UPI003C6C699A
MAFLSAKSEAPSPSPVHNYKPRNYIVYLSEPTTEGESPKERCLRILSSVFRRFISLDYAMNRKIRNFFSIIVIVSCALCQVHSQNKASNASSAYTDSFVLACGAITDATDANGRKWIQDNKFLASLDESSSSSAVARSQDHSLPSTVPYMTARIFYSKTTYKFPVSPMLRHWIRLHFYPSWYKNLDPSNSFFSVTAGGFTLLSNFSASITAQALTQAYIVREFALRRLDSNALDLTFTPSPTYNGSFAFVNGVEVISIPEIFHPVSMIGFSDKNMETEHHTFQTMYRLNVGGQYIPASKDSGLNRTWNDDSPYIFGAAFGVTSEADNNVSIKYPYDELKYIAPYNVYRTARSMGPNSSINQNYNLTWVFRIDVNFTYLVRLHFCEFYFEKVNQRVFSVFINSRMAEEVVDVIAWAKGRGVPVYKDFAVYVNGRTGDDQMLISLQPNIGVKPEYYDSVLNGLEIFKLNDMKGNLAGPNPVPQLVKTEAQLKHGTSVATPKLSNHGKIIGSVLGSLVVFGLVVGLVVFVKQAKSRTDDASSRIGGWFPIHGNSHSSETRTTSKSSRSSRISNLGGVHCRHFTLADLRLATDNFSESSVIGFGGFGKVYRGFINGNTKKVAIKRANPSSQQGVHEFLNEIELLSKLRHRHLVSLIGACEENDEMILVYDYMGNGTLREHLYNGENPPLTWRERLDICIGAARGIHYLHTGARYTIIHRDVKSTNILLDENWVAKVSDFGLSKTGPTLHQTHISTIVKGSFGYLDPEYFRRQQLTDKSDVYSFGVVLFEVLCGRPALNPNLPKEQVSLADWALSNHKRGTLEQIMDQHIRGEINSECLKHFTETAAKCLSDHGLDRPSMGSVLRNLEYCLQLRNNPDGPQVAAELKANDPMQCMQDY